VLLFNFDFDDDAVKAEHKAWLTEHAVPSLKATNKRVVLRGIASKIGDQQYNLQLSKRRVEASASS
jgi:outer membrane protein OmpA-like peptidoglycan-associated protein